MPGPKQADRRLHFAMIKDQTGFFTYEEFCAPCTLLDCQFNITYRNNLETRTAIFVGGSFKAGCVKLGCDNRCDMAVSQL